MSTCISRHGEYGSHEPPSFGDDPFCCHRCGVFDEERVLELLGDAEAEVERIRALLADESTALVVFNALPDDDPESTGLHLYEVVQVLTTLASVIRADLSDAVLAGVNTAEPLARERRHEPWT